MQALICPTCGQPYRSGELACSHCGMVFIKGGKTRLISDAEIAAVEADHPRDKGRDVAQAAVSFEIDGQRLILPIDENIIIGRTSDIPDAAQPDVDLSRFGADEKGVSRRHLQIKYKGYLTYAIDLGSSNGTFHNGKRLTPQRESLLHNGDELQLGSLKIKVQL